MTKIVGILNITPDSFSDGGKFFSPQTTISHLKKMIEEGADIIDIGAESTRPNATPISAQEEWLRLEKILPQIIFEIKKYPKLKSSIDSYHFENIKKSYELGVDIVNDVSGLVDEKIINFVAQNNITTILMHNLAIHANPELVVNQNLDINKEIIKWAENKIATLGKKGVKKSQLIFDPGIGFAKDARQSIGILKNINSYRVLGLPIYVGHSKKRFLNNLDIKGDAAEKTLTVSKYLIEREVDFIRVHDISAHKKLFLAPKNNASPL
jgi:dihydropteroate synthase